MKDMLLKQEREEHEKRKAREEEKKRADEKRRALEREQEEKLRAQSAVGAKSDDYISMVAA